MDENQLRDKLLNALVNSNFHEAQAAVDSGADVNMPSKFGRTLLQQCGAKRQKKAVKWLLENGADPLTKDHEGRNHWDLTLYREISECKCGGYTRPGEFEQFASEMFEKGADINSTFIHNTSYLHQATSYGSVEAMEVFIDHGVDLNRQDNNGDTALHKALYDHDYGMEKVAMLLESGADSSLKNKDGKTAFECAQASFAVSNHPDYEKLANLIESFTEKRELEKRLGLSDEVKTAKKVKV